MSESKINFPMIFTPLVSVFILTIGNSFYTTYTTIELERVGIANTIVGLIAAASFLGMMLGSYSSQKLIFRIGYIRSYILFSVMISLCSMIQGIFYEPYLWGFLRFLCGYALSGLFIVTESWCLEGAGEKLKGLVLSFYLSVYYLAQASGQLILNIEFNNYIIPFCMISILASLSIIPINLTKFDIKHQDHSEMLSPSVLWKKVPLGLWSAFVAGMILGSIYSVYPLFLKKVSTLKSDVAYAMFAVVIGGMSLQLPIGKISDFKDRRKVIFFITNISLIISILMCFLYKYNIIILSFLLGGFTFTLYPLSISYACDCLNEKNLVGVVSLLALFYGLGSMFGPIFSTLSMSLFGDIGFFVFISSSCALLAFYTSWRMKISTETCSQDEKVQFHTIAPEISIATETVYEQQVIEDKKTDS